MGNSKRQAISSFLLQEKREYIDSSLCRAEVSFQQLLHKVLLRRICVISASHNFKIELPL